MGKNDDDKKKVGAISSSTGTKGVRGTDAVHEVEKVKGTAAVGGVSNVSGVGKAAAIGAMSFEQRERLLSIVSQEAEKLAAQGVIPKNQRAIVEQAVRMVIDASLLEASETKKK